MSKIDKCGLDDLEYYRRRSFLLKYYCIHNVFPRDIEGFLIEDLKVYWNQFKESYESWIAESS